MGKEVTNKISSKRYEALVIPANLIKGVHIPFISLAPKGDYSGNPVLLFMDESGKTFAESIENIMDSVLNIASTMGIKGPVIIPVLPSKDQFDKALFNSGVDFQVGDSKTLCRECFSPEIPLSCPFYRLDRQLDMILDATGISDKFVGFGHAKAGMTMMRYAMISPERFDKLVIGGNMDCIPIVSGANAKLFDYPLGMRDHDILFGKSYRDALCRGIDYEFYLSKKGNKILYGDGSSECDLLCSENYVNGKSGWKVCPPDIAQYYRDQYGEDILDRFSAVMNEYDKAFLNTHLKLYDGEFYRFITRSDFQDVVYNNGSFDEFPVRQIHDFLSE